MTVQPPPYSQFDNKPSLQDVPYPRQEQYSYQNQAHSPYPMMGQPGAPYTVTMVQQFREVPCRVVCQYCNTEGITKIRYKSGTLTWASCFFISLVMPLGCCLIPFCLKACKDPVHFCPHCDSIVGRYSRMWKHNEKLYGYVWPNVGHQMQRKPRHLLNGYLTLS